MAGLILHLVRHPPPMVAPGVCYGRLDVPASDIDAAADRLRGLLPEGLPVWSSPLRRCRALAECLHPAPRLDARLQEMDFGAWEGQRWDRIERAALDAWAADVVGFAPPGGESGAAVQARALAWVADCGDGEAVVVTHGGVIRVLLAHWRGVPLVAGLDQPVAPGSVTTVEIGAAGAVVRRLNR